MIEIIINYNHTSIETNDLQLIIEGGFEIKKEGDNPPIIKVKSTNDNKP